MDPQKLSSLDPKLREAYQRVMGTTIPEPQTTPASPQGEPAQTPTLDPTSAPQPQPTTPIEPSITPPASEPPPPAPVAPEPITEPQPAINPQPQPAPTPEPAVSAQPTSNFVQMNSEVASTPAFISPNFSAPAPQAQTVALKKKNKMTPVLFGFVGLIFIVVYALFWTKIFNLKLPFLP